MSKRMFYSHWVVGILSVIVWFWAPYLLIPKDGQVAAGQLTMALIGSILASLRTNNNITAVDSGAVSGGAASPASSFPPTTAKESQ